MNSADFDFIKKNLKECDNVSDMLQILLNHYDLKNCKPGFLVKDQLIRGLMTAITMLNPKEK